MTDRTKSASLAETGAEAGCRTSCCQGCWARSSTCSSTRVPRRGPWRRSCGSRRRSCPAVRSSRAPEGAQARATRSARASGRGSRARRGPRASLVARPSKRGMSRWDGMSTQRGAVRGVCTGWGLAQNRGFRSVCRTHLADSSCKPCEILRFVRGLSRVTSARRAAIRRSPRAGCSTRPPHPHPIHQARAPRGPPSTR